MIDYGLLSYYAPHFFFYFFAIIAVASGLGVLLLRNVFHCALSLIVSLTSLGGLFLLLNAEFMAAVQFFVFVGGITMLLVFGIFMTRTYVGVHEHRFNRWLWPAVAVGVVFFLVYGFAGWSFMFRTERQFSLIPNPKLIGWSLFATYTLPFEIASVILLVALVGAAIIAKKEW